MYATIDQRAGRGAKPQRYPALIDPASEFTASDILAPQAWTPPRAQRLHTGLDVTCTKIAVDFQNLSRDTAESVLRENLDLLRDASGCDAALTIALDPTGLVMENVTVSRGTFAQCHPEALRGDSIETWAWLRTRLDHLRLSLLLDTATPRRDQQVEAQRLAGLHVGSMLLVAYRIDGVPAGFLGLANSLPRDTWDVNLQLLLKLLGTSLATGLGRLRSRRAWPSSRNAIELSKDAANDGLWDFDVERNEMYFSPRWRAMLGYSDDRTSTWRPTGAASCIPRT